MPGLWAGVLLCIALIATPAPFATLVQADAGRVVARIFAQEAWLSIGLGGLLLMLERRAAAEVAEAGRGSQFTLEMGLTLLALGCTVLGYYGLQPMIAAAKAGQPTPLGFAALHGLSFGLFAVKIVAVTALAWRAARAPVTGSGPSS
ncbi:DUF4149 domain-containing protein [Ideonella sp. 4Y11]|uniref:DUF4149 domain-containing protein n=1 Tax=Ideonella aquatica TaxID=2824119 RepID=A0A940YKU4_9BURK|nr:DUF4149 domain-containing protein [Ideonella aquatica]